jgi:transcriptional regulator with XRE-family HTH domain
MAALNEVRRRSALTWSQLAHALGVDRRSLHLWARGARLSAENARRLERLRTIVRHLDVGRPDNTRQRILSAAVGPDSVLDLLAQRRDDDVLAWLREREAPQPRRRRGPTELSPAERASRRAFSPIELLDARHEPIPERSRFRGAIAVPSFEKAPS